MTVVSNKENRIFFIRRAFERNAFEPMIAPSAPNALPNIWPRPRKIVMAATVPVGRSERLKNYAAILAADATRARDMRLSNKHERFRTANKQIQASSSSD